MTQNINELIKALNRFAKERDWDKYHSPKNLTMALSGEVGELTELFQWLTEEESQNLTEKQKEKVSEELADIFLYLLHLADKTSVDLISAAHEKMSINAAKYPIEKSYGSAQKYTQFD
ncbi:nucleotide pyrophosphohydrolase [Vibrio sinaloensis]|uniref:nucleotide pyrophosphohydrolase n=1 Tax=Photobacterium sp. (strain ATCC 43367) TaxID=379097 RepID=UPI0022AE5541|nr:nucleotide pyrophosphohydrolase [Vibrio sinaloensis]MCZ4295118.1 nucleotide pyrophosphohydrolase [Vibrio sinaloensis]